MTSDLTSNALPPSTQCSGLSPASLGLGASTYANPAPVPGVRLAAATVPGLAETVAEVVEVPAAGPLELHAGAAATTRAMASTRRERTGSFMTGAYATSATDLLRPAAVGRKYRQQRPQEGR